MYHSSSSSDQPIINSGQRKSIWAIDQEAFKFQWLQDSLTWINEQNMIYNKFRHDSEL